MFQFSLFSSFIPYLTIAVMYVLYLGVYTYNKLNADKEQVDVEDATENTVSWEPLTSQKTIQVSNDLFFADDGPAEPNADLAPAPLLSTCRKLPKPFGEIPVSGCLCFNLYSRPPPQLS